MRLDADVPSGSHVFKLEQFQPGVTFDHVVELFRYDQRIRALLTEALARIEQALKVDLAYHLGEVDTFAHLYSRHFRSEFVSPRPYFNRHGHSRTNKSHSEWVVDHYQKLDRPHDFVKRYKAKYGNKFPIWIAIEAMDFGDALYLIEGLHQRWRAPMAARFRVPDDARFVSWLRTLRTLRNLCAHSGRVWNHALSATPSPVSTAKIPVFASLNEAKKMWEKPYATYMIVAYLTKQVTPHSQWNKRFAAAFDSLPIAPGIDIVATGAPTGWQTDPMWS